MNGRVDVDLAVLAKNWWLVALRGVARDPLRHPRRRSCPGSRLAVLVMLFGAYALIEGGFNVIAGHPARRGASARGGRCSSRAW